MWKQNAKGAPSALCPLPDLQLAHDVARDHAELEREGVAREHGDDREVARRADEPMEHQFHCILEAGLGRRRVGAHGG